MENVKKYRYKQTNEIVEAVQYTGKNDFQLSQWSDRCIVASPVLEPSEDYPSGRYTQVVRNYYDYNEESNHGCKNTANIGDWIIRINTTPLQWPHWYCVTDDFFKSNYAVWVQPVVSFVPELIQTVHLEIIENLTQCAPSVYLTGSAVLVLLKIIRRPINDLDFVVRDRKEFKHLYEVYGGQLYENYEKLEIGQTDQMHYANQFRTKVNGIDVCVFNLECSNEIVWQEYINDTLVLVSNPHSIIGAKLHFVHTIIDKGVDESNKKRLQKHLQDIRDYHRFVENKINNEKI